MLPLSPTPPSLAKSTQKPAFRLTEKIFDWSLWKLPKYSSKRPISSTGKEMFQMQTGYKCYRCDLMTQILCVSVVELADVAFPLGLNDSLIP